MYVLCVGLLIVSSGEHVCGISCHVASFSSYVGCILCCNLGDIEIRIRLGSA